MFRKYKYSFAIILLITCLLAFLYFNSNKKTYADDLNESLKDVIDNSNLDYNYTEDEYFINKLDDLVKFAYKDIHLLDEHYVFEDLDKDSIPEIIVFRQRDAENFEDQGSLDIHKYINGQYVLIDSMSMNYDNTCYELKVGNISNDTKGIYLNNQVGAHSGMTYGFILENNKIVNILNPNKLNLLSVYTNNEIKDIDNDGILNFSIYTIDPEEKDKAIVESEKISLWYEWNGFDSANLVAVEKNGKIENRKIVHDSIVDTGLNILTNNPKSFIEYLDSNLDQLNKMEVSFLLTKYIQSITSKISSLNNKKNNLIDDKIIQEYIVASPNDSEDLVVNFDYFSKKYNNYISSEFIDVLDILSIKPNVKENTNDYLDHISKRIVKIENFKTIYPYSEFINYLNKIYKTDMSSLLFENSDSLNFTSENKLTSKGLNKLIKIKTSYPNTNLASIIDLFLDKLNNNNLIMNDEIREDISVSYK